MNQTNLNEQQFARAPNIPHNPSVEPQADYLSRPTLTTRFRTVRELATRNLLALLVSFAVLSISGVAVGVYSWNGSDYSWDYSSTGIQTCDMESDSTKVKSKADNDNDGSGSNAAKDVDGNNGICATANMGWDIWRHKTCEYRSFWPDDCGNWQDVNAP